MEDEKTKDQLLDDINKLKKQIEELEKSVSEGQRAKESLKEREIYLKTIFSAIQTGIVVIDSEKNEITDLNDVAANLIGDSKDEIIGHRCHKYICPADEGKCPIIDLNQKLDHSERVLLNLNGEEIAIIKNVVPIYLDDHEYLIESFIDISERKKSEEALKKSEEKYKTIVGKFLKMSNEILIEVSKKE